MNDLLKRVLDQFVGPTHWSALSAQNDSPYAGGRARPVLVSFDLSKNTRRDLTRQAGIRSHHFIVLPSYRAPRLLLPSGDARMMRKSLQVFAAFSPSARILKAVLTGVLRTGWPSWAGHTLLITSREALPLDCFVREVTGEVRPVFALSLGTPGRFRKLTVQAMRPSGEILGYIKLPLTPSATERICHEAEVLERLATYPALRSRIPNVLHAGKWGDGYLLFQSGGPSRPGPLEFKALHEDFLQTLRSLHRVERPGAALVQEVASRWRRAELPLDSDLRALGEAALKAASRMLHGCKVQCGIIHGDFAPWNTRVEDGRLYLFDWESATWVAPVSWDLFHFATNVASSFKSRRRWDPALGESRAEHGSFLLYIVSSLSQLIDEGHPDHAAGIDYRRQLLTEALRDNPVE